MLDKKFTLAWTAKHKAMLKARVSSGLFPPAVYAKDDETKLCKMCKVPCTQAHRDMVCPAR